MFKGFTRYLAVGMMCALPPLSAAYVYIADNNNPSAGQNSIVVIDEDTLTVVSSTIATAVAAGDQVQIAIRPAIGGFGPRLYAPSFLAADSVSVFDIDTTTGALTHIPGSPFTTTQGMTMAPFLSPFGVAVAPDGSVYLTNFAPDMMGNYSVFKVDADLNYLASASTMLGNLGPIAIDSTGNNVYIGMTGASMIALYNSSLALVTTVSSGAGNPYAVAVAPNDAYIFSTTTAGTISRYDYPGLGGATMVSYPMTGPITMAFHGTTMYVANTATNNVSVFDFNLNLTGSIPSQGTNPYVVAVDPAGDRIYTTNSNDGFLSIANTSDSSPITGSPFPILIRPYGIAFLPQAIAPISNLTGAQLKDDFGLIYEYYNLLAWQAPAGASVAGYKIYKDDALIASVGSGTLSYEDHNQIPGTRVTYSVSSVDAAGNESDPIDVTIN